jgi:hypothetical protein
MVFPAGHGFDGAPDGGRIVLRGNKKSPRITRINNLALKAPLRKQALGYVVLIRYLYSGFNPLFERPEAPPRTGERVLCIKPLNTNKRQYKGMGKLLVKACDRPPAKITKFGIFG